MRYVCLGLIGVGLVTIVGCFAPPPVPPTPAPKARPAPAAPVSPSSPPAPAGDSATGVDAAAQARQQFLSELPAEDSPPLAEASLPAPPPPPPEIPPEVRTRLESVGARIDDKPNGYAIDIRNKPGFTDAEIDLVVACPQVVDLTLENVAITDAGLKKLEPLTDVARLILNGSPISSDGIATLAELPLGKKLFSIGLRGTKVTDDDIEQLRKFPRLQRLDVSQTSVTDACLPTIERLPLRYLNVAKTQITEAKLADLKLKKPNLEVNR